MIPYSFPNTVNRTDPLLLWSDQGRSLTTLLYNLYRTDPLSYSLNPDLNRTDFTLSSQLNRTHHSLYPLLIFTTLLVSQLKKTDPSLYFLSNSVEQIPHFTSSLSIRNRSLTLLLTQLNETDSFSDPSLKQNQTPKTNRSQTDPSSYFVGNRTDPQISPSPLKIPDSSRDSSPYTSKTVPSS